MQLAYGFKMRRLACSPQALKFLQQFSVQLRPATSVAHDAIDIPARPADWANAKPYTSIPGPKGLPVIGNVHRFLPHIGEYHGLPLPDYVQKLNQQYGRIVKLGGMIGRPDMLFISSADDMAHIFRNEGTWPVRQGGDSLVYYIRNLRKGSPVSLIGSQGKEWQEFRTAINQVMMQPRNTKQYVEPIDEVGRELVNRMKTVRDSNLKMPDDFTNEISKWALESIAYIVLDVRLGLLRDLEPGAEGARMIANVHTMFDSIYELDMMPSPWKYISTPAYRKFVNAMDIVTAISTKYVNLAMERLTSLPRSDLDDRSYSVLENLLIRSGDAEKAVAMALDMLLAGIDTTGATVQTVFYQLAVQPEKQKKLQEELDMIMPDPSKPLTKDLLEEMKYMRACIKETMRVMPSLTGNTRTTTKDMVVAGYQIPKDTMIFMNTSMTGKEYFPRPLEFVPERWLPGGEDLKGNHPFAFLPFGFGPRMCAGRRFAELEIETVVANTFRNLTLEWTGQPPKSTFYMVHRFTDPLNFTVKDRL